MYASPLIFNIYISPLVILYGIFIDIIEDYIMTVVNILTKKKSENLKQFPLKSMFK